MHGPLQMSTRTGPQLGTLNEDENKANPGLVDRKYQASLRVNAIFRESRRPTRSI